MTSCATKYLECLSDKGHFSSIKQRLMTRVGVLRDNYVLVCETHKMLVVRNSNPNSKLFFRLTSLAELEREGVLETGYENINWTNVKQAKYEKADDSFGNLINRAEQASAGGFF